MSMCTLLVADVQTLLAKQMMTAQQKATVRFFLPCMDLKVPFSHQRVHEHLVNPLTCPLVFMMLTVMCQWCLRVSADSLLQQVFEVRFLGSMAVRYGKNQEVIYEAMRQVLAARAIHNIFRTTESHLMVTSSSLRWDLPHIYELLHENCLSTSSHCTKVCITDQAVESVNITITKRTYLEGRTFWSMNISITGDKELHPRSCFHFLVNMCLLFVPNRLIDPQTQVTRISVSLIEPTLIPKHFLFPTPGSEAQSFRSIFFLKLYPLLISSFNALLSVPARRGFPVCSPSREREADGIRGREQGLERWRWGGTTLVQRLRLREQHRGWKGWSFKHKLFFFQQGETCHVSAAQMDVAIHPFLFFFTDMLHHKLGKGHNRS